MIGDNPLTDIRGARLAGAPWFSILVRGGMWQDGEDDGGADAIVDGVGEAVALVMDHAKSAREH